MKNYEAAKICAENALKFLEEEKLTNNLPTIAFILNLNYNMIIKLLENAEEEYPIAK